MNYIKSVLNYNCPRCRKFKMYKEPFLISKPVEMHRNCEVCNQRFEPEPGFYFGAMFISYIISGFLFVGIALTLVFAFNWSFNAAMGLVLFIAIISFFKLMRISRSMWIHFIVNYDPNYSKS